MLRHLCFILLFLCSLKAGAVSVPDSVMFKSYAGQYHYRHRLLAEIAGETTLEQKIAALDEMIAYSEEKDDVQLAYGLKISRAGVIIQSGHKDEQKVEAQLLSIISQLEKNKMPELKAEAQYWLSEFYWRKKRYPEALEYSTYAYKTYNKWDVKRFPPKPIILREFGGQYFFFEDYATATYYNKAAYEADTTVKTDYIFTLLNTLALCYLRRDKLDSANFYMKKGYELAVKQNDKVWVAIISGNLGALNNKMGRYEEALYWFDNEVKNFGDRRSMNVANTYAGLAEIYIARKEKEKALKYANMAYEILQTHEDYPRKHNMTGAIYMGLAKAHAANGNMDLAYRFLDSARIAKDSVVKEKNANILAGASHKVVANERLAEQEKFEREAKNYRALRNILIAGIILVVIIAILLYNRQRLKHTFTQKQLEAEKKHVESELDIATKQLDNLVGSISEKNELIERFTAELDRLREHLSDEKLFKADEALLHLQQSTVIADEEWEHFVQMFEKVNTGFLKRLDSKVRGLSPIETKFIMLSKMKLSTKEVASALGISADAVRLNRKRLYAKLGLAEGEHSLQALIDSI
jgi:tetratricopeptide (TPR) repeat protein